MESTRFKSRNLEEPPKLPMRERVLDAAFSVFMEKGYSATSTLEIATRAKVSKRELYQICADKPALLRHAIAERAQRMRQPLDLPPATDRKALFATLKALGVATLRGLSDPAVQAVHRLVISESVPSSEVVEALAGARGAGRIALARTLAQAQTNDLIEKGDTQAMAADFFALLVGDLMMKMLLRIVEPPKPRVIERMAVSAAEKFLRLHFKRPARQRSSADRRC
jgi:AcrR family transcriptional regulator